MDAKQGTVAWRHRWHSAESKAKVVAECRHPGVSIGSHHAYVFTNRRANRLKVFAHGGIGLWLCARRLYQERLVWPVNAGSGRIELSRVQLDALVVGLA
jgi:transposase